MRKRDVGEMLDVLLEIWSEELTRPGGHIRIEGLGKLYVERQRIRSTGAVRAMLRSKGKPVPATLNRYYFRFRPSERLYATLVAAEEEAQK